MYRVTKYCHTYCYLLLCFSSFLLLANRPCKAGVLIVNGAQNIQFIEALSISVNGKDKVLQLGSEPSLQGPLGKLPSLKLEGMVLKDVKTGAMVLNTEGSQVYLLPEGLPKNGPTSLSAAWRDATVFYKRSKSDKSPGQISFSSFIAFLPGGLPELAGLCTNEQLLNLVGSSKGVFAMQSRLITAAVKAYPSDPALNPVQKYVEAAMRSRYERFEDRTASIDVFNQAVALAALSASVYPNLPEQVKLREQIAGTRKWLDERTAILRAFAAGDEWDQYILADHDFEKYEQAFPDLASLRLEALKESLDYHRQAGERFLKEREFEAAHREFRTASLRQPSDRLLQQRVLMSWTDYSRDVALDDQRNRKQLGTGEQEILNQAIQFATNYKNENKLDLALKSIQDAETVDPNSLPMLLKKAEILGAQHEFSKAFLALDRYDLHAVDEERAKSSSLRNDLLFQQKSSLEDIKEQIRKEWADGSYHKLHDLALQGLRASSDDADLLYQAGVSSIVTRDPKSAQDFFFRYLEITNTLDASSEQRARVRTLLASVQFRNHKETGEPNWLSGRKLPADVYYCPYSLAFQPHVDHVEASNKMHVAYEWNGNQLVSITPSFEKAEHATGEKRISFVYNDVFPQVLLVSDTDARLSKPTVSDPDERLKLSSLVVLNNPSIDPDAIEKLTGRNITVGISGNRFFEPFVWDKVHYFRLKYDSEGRVMEAREMADRNGTLTGLTLEFEWSGLHLIAVRGFQGSNVKLRTKVYDRVIQYDDGRIVSEEIEGAGKSARIKYNYNGDRLVSATCSSDPTLDGRSRQVTFR